MLHSVASLPDLEKVEACSEITEDQRARQFRRHPELPVNAIFSEDDMREIDLRNVEGRPHQLDERGKAASIRAAARQH